MPFENFYEKLDKEIKRHWKSVVSTFALLAVVFISLTGLCSIYENRINDYFKEKARIERLDALCKNLSKPDLFYLVTREKPVSYNTDATEIVYHYQTERDPKVIIPQFIEWFSANGWKRKSDNELIFTKDLQTISFTSSDNFYSHYDIYCYEDEISFGIYD